MTKLVKTVDNKYVQIEEYKNPNICFNTNKYDNFKDYCTLKETFDPFEIFYENQELKEKIKKLSQWDTDKDTRNSRQRVANAKLLKENQELREKLDEYENPENMTLMMMWCTEQVKDENKKLKKQLENKYEKVGTLTNELLYEENTKLINQQKEFINYLNSYINLLNDKPDMLEETQKDILEEILQKYREIIGVSDEKK